jgi:hypothetical protein
LRLSERTVIAFDRASVLYSSRTPNLDKGSLQNVVFAFAGILPKAS